MAELTHPHRIVVIGTGTGVGKTWLSCELLRAFARAGTRGLGLKPIESGVTDLAASDAALLAAAGSVALSAPAGAPEPYRFVEAISPHRAARRAGVTVELERALTYVRYHESSAAAPPPSMSVIETAGGLLSPL